MGVHPTKGGWLTEVAHQVAQAFAHHNASLSESPVALTLGVARDEEASTTLAVHCADATGRFAQWRPPKRKSMGYWNMPDLEKVQHRANADLCFGGSDRKSWISRQAARTLPSERKIGDVAVSGVLGMPGTEKVQPDRQSSRI